LQGFMQCFDQIACIHMANRAADQMVKLPLLGIGESSEDQRTAATLGATGGLDGFNTTPASWITTLAAG
jgi:hypothetical protein